MLRNENAVRYAVLKIEDGRETPWYVTTRGQIRKIIVRAERQGILLKIVRYWPESIVYDSVQRPEYDTKTEKEMIYNRK